MPRGSNPKREKEYEDLKDKFHQQHRYPGRGEEVAARIVNKQRAQSSETRQERQKDKTGKSPDRDLPIPGYDHLGVKEVLSRAGSLSQSQRRKIASYERTHKNRKTLLTKLGQ